ncbi:very short patch repair endonuclease [Parasutterella secunda]|uniref:very short patch repair endonuclease n=1 Tax=Parasutterella secunda TaxID=626947 RepID=UPI0021ACDE48|nr:very short patch repair endonuclease [Parasutterella secunda]MCR8921116.1 very short patch repair endonuclease [Parasutterella secunda]
MDNKTKAERSLNMSRIHAKDTKPELTIRRLLFADGFRYRIHVKTLPGTPDLVLPKYRAVIFVHGCFWHGHDGCKYAKLPTTHVEFWRDKISKNKERDQRVRQELVSGGWRVLTIWTCSINNQAKVKETYTQVKDWILNKAEQSVL